MLNETCARFPFGSLKDPAGSIQLVPASTGLHRAEFTPTYYWVQVLATGNEFKANRRFRELQK